VAIEYGSYGLFLPRTKVLVTEPLSGNVVDTIRRHVRFLYGGR
jgi:hypothetical protein